MNLFEETILPKNGTILIVMIAYKLLCFVLEICTEDFSEILQDDGIL